MGLEIVKKVKDMSDVWLDRWMPRWGLRVFMAGLGVKHPAMCVHLGGHGIL